MIISILLILHFYFPIVEYGFIDISPDFLLIIIIINSFYLSDSKVLLSAFIIGLLKDLLTQSDYLGLLTFLSILFAYGLIKIKVYKNKNIQCIVVLFLMFSYFFINYFLKYSESYLFYLKFSLIQSIITSFALIFCHFIFKGRLNKNAKS
tara:strand:+ start:165 stop:614 length:450 start_codon:yes stop_codon:yes gene_type:complete